MKIKDIDTSTTEGKIQVMQAFENGETIVYRRASSVDMWVVVPYPTWDWSDCDYGAVEKAREIWINFYEDDEFEVYLSKESAERCAMYGRMGSAVKFVEVVE